MVFLLVVLGVPKKTGEAKQNEDRKNDENCDHFGYSRKS